MLKGQVFSKQLFENQIFALFINTFLEGNNGVSDNYGNGMAVTYSGSNVTIASGAVCIQGRFLEEDTSTTISAGTDSNYCKLVVEIDLDETNTESTFNQGSYKILKNSSAYPTLTQENIVKNNAGVYQYELARFQTSSNGISNFQDMRTFLNFDSIYSKIESEYETILEELQEELADVEDGSAYVLKANYATLSANVTPDAQGNVNANWNFPTGFNFSNTIVLQVKDIQQTGGVYDFSLINNASISLDESGVSVSYVDRLSYRVEVTIMRI